MTPNETIFRSLRLLAEGYKVTLRFFVSTFDQTKIHNFAKMMLHSEATKLRNIEKRQFLKSWDFLDAIGMSAMKNYPQWKDFQVSTKFGGGVKVDITIFFLDFWPNKQITISRKWCCITKLRNCEKIQNRQFSVAGNFWTPQACPPWNMTPNEKKIKSLRRLAEG